MRACAFCTLGSALMRSKNAEVHDFDVGDVLQAFAVRHDEGRRAARSWCVVKLRHGASRSKCEREGDEKKRMPAPTCKNSLLPAL